MSSPTVAIKRDQGYWATIILLLPLVLQRLFIGGTSGGYENYSGYSFFWLGYGVHIGFVLALLLRRVRNRGNLIYWLIAFFAVSVAQAYYVSTIFSGNFYPIILVLLRGILWLLALYAYSVLFFESESFKKAFYDIIFVAGLFIIFCGLYFNLTGVPLGVNIEKGIGRVHGAFSEPSTLASVIPAFTFMSLYLRRYAGVAIGLIAIYGAASVVVTAVFILCLILYLMSRYQRFTKIFLFLIVIAAILMTLSVNNDVVNRLDYLSSGFSKFLDATIGESLFRTYTFDRVLTAIHDLALSLNYATDIRLEESGGLARFVGSITMLKNMAVDGTTWFGYGISVYGFVANALYGTALDFGLYPYFVSSFGVLFGTVFILMLTRQVLDWQKHDRVMFIILSGGLLGTIYNSGGGIIAYSVVMVSIFIRYKEPETDIASSLG
jgi:hypothetical protein